jgi:hypothetical protein
MNSENRLSTLQEALRYAAAGYRVFPLVGKTPIMPMGQNFSQATLDTATIEHWWGEIYPNSNIAIQTGPLNGFFALDIDERTGGYISLQKLIDHHGELPSTVGQTTGGGGQHFLFRYPNKEIRSRNGVWPGIDVKGQGGYIVGPPSIHPQTNVPYQWIDGASLFERDLGECPQWLMDGLERLGSKTPTNNFERCDNDNVDTNRLHYGQKALEEECRRIETATNGTQETTLNQAAFRIGQLVGAKAISFQRAFEALFAAAVRMPSYDHRRQWKHDELSEKIKRGLAAGQQSPREISKSPVSSTDPYQQDELLAAIMEINKYYAVVQLGSKTKILKQGTCPINGWPKVDFLAPDDFKLRFNKYRYVEEGRKEGLGSLWLRNPERREYEEVIFSPGSSSNQHFNLWQGFPIRPVQSDKADRFLAHIDENMAGGNDEIGKHIKALMADAIQNPGSRPGVALVLLGDQGVGKSFFAEQFGSLFGPHYTTIHNPRHVFGDFNASLCQMLMVFVDEVTWVGDERSQGILKGLITAPSINIERKGVDASPVQNFARFILASNSPQVIPAGPHERRFFVVDVQDHRKQDSQYFAAIAEDMENGGREALMHFLQSYDLSKVDLRAFPKTAALHEQKRLNLDLFRRVWLDWLMRGSILTATWEMPILTSAFCTIFREAAADMGQKSELSETAIGQQLRKLLPWDPKSRSSLQGRPYVYTLPPLEECRKYFSLVTGIPVEWPDETEGSKVAA